MTDPKKIAAIKKVLALPENTGNLSRAYHWEHQQAPTLWHRIGKHQAPTSPPCAVVPPSMWSRGVHAARQHFLSACVHNQQSLYTGERTEVHTVFQIAGPETPGILAEVTQLLSHNGLEIRTAAVGHSPHQY